MIYERQIIEFTGLETYKALLRLFPELYQSQYDDGKLVQEYYIQNIQQLMINSGYTPQQLRWALVNTVEKYLSGENVKDTSISNALYHSSPVPTSYAASFMTNAWWFLFMSLFAVFLIATVIWIFQSWYPVDERIPFFNGACDNIWN